MANIMRSFVGRASPILPHLRPDEMGPTIGAIKPSFTLENSHFTFKEEDYLRCCALAKAGARKDRLSVIWYYGEDVVKESEPEGKHYWYCYLCEKASVEMNKLLLLGEGNGAILSHLERTHKINRNTGIRASTTSSMAPSEAGSDSSLANAFGRQRHILATEFNRFKDLLVRWIVYCHIAFFQLENEYFQKLLFWCAPGLEKYLPKAANTIRSWVVMAFEERKERIKQEMREAHSRVHISFDLWSSPNHKAIIGVVAHYITAHGRRRNIAIGLREVFGEHAGENVGHQLLLLFKEYDITDRIGFFICDNDSKNDTCITYLLKKLNPRMSKRQMVRRRIRCMGHIINLCAQTFIIGKDAENVCKELETALREDDVKKIGELWRKRGSIGRLHNIIRYIRASPQRRNRFAKMVIGGELANFDNLEVSV